jgi:hypothetical protein
MSGPVMGVFEHVCMAVLVKHRSAELAYLFAEVGVGVGGGIEQRIRPNMHYFVIIYSTAYTCTGT